MKKIIGIITFLVLGTFVFANETWHSFGFGYGNNYDRILGIDFGIYNYLNEVGMLFFNCNFAKPSNVEDTDNNNYFQFGATIGPGVKFNINKIIKLNIGIGFSYLFNFGDYKDNLLMHFNLGYGGDINLAFIINESIYLHFGTIVNYYFASLETTGTGTYYYNDKGKKKEHIKTDWIKYYSMINIRPYIGVGFILR